MATYHFITHWKVRASCQEVSDIIGDPVSLSKWWPAVYLDVKQIKQGDKNSIGRQVALYTRVFSPILYYGNLKWLKTGNPMDIPSLQKAILTERVTGYLNRMERIA